MANSLYTTYKNRLLGSGTSSLADWDTDTIKAVLTDATYTPAITTDSFLSDIGAGARIATATVGSISISAGAVVVGGTVTFTAVTGATCTRLVLYKDTGTASTSPLLVLFDTFTSGMPITPTGTDIVLSFNASGIIQL